MNLDFHVHGLLTKKSKFDEELFLQGIVIAKEQGLDGYILCEHFNAVNIDEIHDYLEQNYKYVGDKYVINDFSIFLGMEIDIKNGGHIILCSNRDNIYKIKKELKDYMIKPDFIEFEKLLDIGEKYNCLMIGSHPYREAHKLYLQPEELISRLHGLDLNATDLNKKGIDLAKLEVRHLSRKVNIPYITGSDSHYPIQLGSVMTKFKKEFLTVEEIILAIKENKHEIKISNALHTKVFSAKTAKESLKKAMKEETLVEVI